MFVRLSCRRCMTVMRWVTSDMVDAVSFMHAQLHAWLVLSQCMCSEIADDSREPHTHFVSSLETARCDCVLHQTVHFILQYDLCRREWLLYTAAGEGLFVTGESTERSYSTIQLWTLQNNQFIHIARNTVWICEQIHILHVLNDKLCMLSQKHSGETIVCGRWALYYPHWRTKLVLGQPICSLLALVWCLWHQYMQQCQKQKAKHWRKSKPCGESRTKAAEHVSVWSVILSMATFCPIWDCWTWLYVITAQCWNLINQFWPVYAATIKCKCMFKICLYS